MQSYIPSRRNQVKLAAGALVALPIAFATPALADNPHFIRCSLELLTETTTFGRGQTRIDLVTGASVEVSWKEAGLGDNENIDYEVEADATATWACINNGGNFPQDPKKETVEGPVSATGTFNSGKNGQITASLIIDAPDRDPSPCKGNQTDVLLDVSFSDVTVTDLTNMESESCGSISEIFPVPEQ